MTKTELIKKFLDNSCTEEEARLAAQYLQSDPSLLDEMLSKSDWDNTETSLPVSPLIEKEMRQTILAKTSTSPFRIGKSALKAAALIAGVIFGSVWIYNSGINSPGENRVVATNQHSESVKKILNNTSVNKEFILADNSTVILFPGSFIEYKTPFTERIIKLEGKAIFSVTKNAASRFVVYSGAISTTALGTRFLVDNSDEDRNINVKLFEGRVVIQPTDSGNMITETFLEAGEQCFVDKNTMLVKVEPLYTSRSLAQKRITPVDKTKKTAPSVLTAGRLNFSKTPLHEVLENLQVVFKQPIIFNKDEISGSHFTGSFTVNDSLSTILKMISVMNELSVNIGDGSVTINKSSGALADNNDAPGYRITLVENLHLQELAPQADSAMTKLAVEDAPEMIVSDDVTTRYTRIPLSDLIAELQKRTNKRIHFNSDELYKINFTGSIPFDEAVRTTLTMICRTNGLKLTVKKGAYYISKAPQ